MHNNFSLVIYKNDMCLINNIQDEVKYFFNSLDFQESNYVKKINNKNYRIVINEKPPYRVIMISNIKAHIKSKKVAFSECYAMLERCFYLDDMLEKEQSYIKDRFSIFTHNIKTICTMTLQEIDIYSPTGLTSEPATEDLNDYALFKREVERADPKKLSSMIMRIYKNLQNIENDISSYDFTYNKTKSRANVRPHSIHKIISRGVLCCASVLHEEKILISIDSFNEPVKVDFESVQIALFYVMDNIIKYTKPQTTLNISFEKNKINKEISVIFKINSLLVDKDEEEKIFEDQFSGRQAIKCQKNGYGIGMFNAKKMLAISEARIQFLSSTENLSTFLGRTYADNKIIITFKM